MTEMWQRRPSTLPLTPPAVISLLALPAPGDENTEMVSLNFKVLRGNPEGSLVPPHCYGTAQCLFTTLDVGGLATSMLVDSSATTSCLSADFYSHNQK